MRRERNALAIPKGKTFCCLCGGAPITVVVISPLSKVCLDERCVQRIMGAAYDGGPRKETHDAHRSTDQTRGILAPRVAPAAPPASPPDLARTLRTIALSHYLTQRTRTRAGVRGQGKTHLGYLTAWRFWVLQHGRLRGIGHQVVWPQGTPLAAVCLADMRHKKSTPFPVWHCTCGIHGGLPHSLNAIIGQPHPNWWDERLVLGTVALWGRVVTHQDGYRAEFGYPVQLFAEFRGSSSFLALHPRTAAALRKRYGVLIGTPEEAVFRLRNESPLVPV